jgi:hypothetical protein
MADEYFDDLSLPMITMMLMISCRPHPSILIHTSFLISYLPYVLHTNTSRISYLDALDSSSLHPRSLLFFGLSMM